jgi:hypothetical protein
MATVLERALCVGWLFETKSVTQTQRNYRTQYNKQPPSDYAIRDWQWRFLETGSVHDRKRSGRPGVSDECVETIRASFVRSPTKCTRRKQHVASSICLRATIFQNPEWTLWTHSTTQMHHSQCPLMNNYHRRKSLQLWPPAIQARVEHMRANNSF